MTEPYGGRALLLCRHLASTHTLLLLADQLDFFLNLNLYWKDIFPIQRHTIIERGSLETGRRLIIVAYLIAPHYN